MQPVLLVALAVLSVCYADTVRADFSGAGITGFISIDDDGKITRNITIDAAQVNAVVSSCVTTTAAPTLGYHIHMGAPTTNAISPNCEAAVTGGHYDPMAACAAFSGNPLCGGACLTRPKVPYSCTNYLSATGFSTNCEVGDLSGKFGNAGSSVATYNDPGMASAATLQGMSITLHCTAGAPSPNGGSARIACARLVKTTDSTGSDAGARASFGDQFGAKGNFGTGLPGDHLTLKQGKLSLKVTVPAEYASCGPFNYHIHEKWTPATPMDYAVGPTLCGPSVTGGHWDPGYGCAPATGNLSCASLGGCIAPSQGLYGTAYTCNTTYPFGCEVGDLSSKYGALTPVAGNLQLNTTDLPVATQQAFAPLLPNPRSVFDRSVVFHCAAGTRAFCFKLDYGIPAPGPTPLPDPSLIDVTWFDNNQVGNGWYRIRQGGDGAGPNAYIDRGTVQVKVGGRYTIRWTNIPALYPFAVHQDEESAGTQTNRTTGFSGISVGGWSGTGAVTWNVPASANKTCFYVSETKKDMGGRIDVEGGRSAGVSLLPAVVTLLLALLFSL